MSLYRMCTNCCLILNHDQTISIGNLICNFQSKIKFTHRKKETCYFDNKRVRVLLVKRKSNKPLFINDHFWYVTKGQQNKDHKKEIDFNNDKIVNKKQTLEMEDQSFFGGDLYKIEMILLWTKNFTSQISKRICILSQHDFWRIAHP